MVRATLDLLYIAFSKGTSPALVTRWQEKLDELKMDGTFEKIYRSYIPDADMNNLLKK
jgi:polar amino acid transport system substrate-binding protein